MKTLNKFLSLLVIILLVAPMSLVPSVASAVTQTTIFSDGFEYPGITNSSSPWTEDPDVNNKWVVTSLVNIILALGLVR